MNSKHNWISIENRLTPVLFYSFTSYYMYLHDKGSNLILLSNASLLSDEQFSGILNIVFSLIARVTACGAWKWNMECWEESSFIHRDHVTTDTPAFSIVTFLRLKTGYGQWDLTDERAVRLRDGNVILKSCFFCD